MINWVFRAAITQSLLVGGIPTPLKNMKFTWDDEIPSIWKNKKCSKPPTRLTFRIFRTLTSPCCFASRRSLLSPQAKLVAQDRLSDCPPHSLATRQRFQPPLHSKKSVVQICQNLSPRYRRVWTFLASIVSHWPKFTRYSNP